MSFIAQVTGYKFFFQIEFVFTLEQRGQHLGGIIVLLSFQTIHVLFYHLNLLTLTTVNHLKSVL